MPISLHNNFERIHFVLTQVKCEFWLSIYSGTKLGAFLLLCMTQWWSKLAISIQPKISQVSSCTNEGLTFTGLGVGSGYMRSLTWLYMQSTWTMYRWVKKNLVGTSIMLPVFCYPGFLRSKFIIQLWWQATPTGLNDSVKHEIGKIRKNITKSNQCHVLQNWKYFLYRSLLLVVLAVFFFLLLRPMGNIQWTWFI